MAVLLSGLKWHYYDLFSATGVRVWWPLVADKKADSIPLDGDVYLFPFAALLLAESGTWPLDQYQNASFPTYNKNVKSDLKEC